MAVTAPVRARRATIQAARRREPLRLLLPLLRLRWLLLTAWAGVTCAGTYSASNDWSLFSWGGDLLFGIHRPFGVHQFPDPIIPQAPAGLHLFANYHILQMGPLPLLFSAGFNQMGEAHGHMAAVALIEVIGLVCLWLFERTALRLRGRDDMMRRVWIPLTTLIGGFAFLQVWSEVSGRWAHLDDALAVLCFAIGTWAIANRKPGTLGIALGLAIASKPWAVGLAPLVLVFRGRERWRAAIFFAASTILPWAPFLIADWRTIQAGNLGIFIQPASPLTVFGFHPQPFNHASSWRMLQFAAELITVFAAVRWRVWGAALLACLAIRLALDPMTYGYYQASFAAGAIAFDLLVWKRPLPIATAVAGMAWITSIEVGRGSQGAPLLAAYLLALAVVVVGAALRNRRRRSVAGTPALAAA